MTGILPLGSPDPRKHSSALYLPRVAFSSLVRLLWLLRFIHLLTLINSLLLFIAELYSTVVWTYPHFCFSVPQTMDTGAVCRFKLWVTRLWTFLCSPLCAHMFVFLFHSVLTAGCWWWYKPYILLKRENESRYWIYKLVPSTPGLQTLGWALDTQESPVWILSFQETSTGPASGQVASGPASYPDISPISPGGTSSVCMNANLG